MPKIKDLRPQDRPREKFLKKGVEYLSDAELLAIFLRTGVAGKSVIELAQELLLTFGLAELFKLTVNDIKDIKGFGQAKLIQLQAVLALAQRYLALDPQLGETIDSSEKIISTLTLRSGHLKDEVFSVVFLDNQNRVIIVEDLFYGTINSTAVHPRIIIKKCIQHNASAIILSHNHPSKLCEPSPQDESITNKIKMALNYIDVRLLDHIIIAGSKHYSFAEHSKI